MLDRQSVRAKIGGFLKRPPAELTDVAVLTDLVAESFVLVEMVIELQEDLGVRLMHDDLKDVKTVGDLLRVLEAKS